MTFTLAQLTYKVARELGICKEGTATGGSATSIADTVVRTEAEDFWNGGSAWILRDAGGASAAPEGEMNYITDFANTGGVVTVRNAWSASSSVASGDRYAIAYKYVPLDVIIQKINQALIDYGPILYRDLSSLTISSSQREYALPVASKLDLRQVFLQMNTSDTDDNQWKEIYNWSVTPTTAGNTATLILQEQPDSGQALMLIFTALHPELLVGTAQLSEHIPVERILYPAIRDCFQYRKDNTGWSDWDEQIGRWTERVEAMRVRQPARYPSKPGQLVIARQKPSRGYPGSSVTAEDNSILWG